MLETIADLQKSDIYDDEMKKWPSFRIARFLDVFKRVYGMVKSRGGGDQEAHSNAAALARASARRYVPTPAEAKLESEVHYFVPLQSHQFSMGAEAHDLSFDYLLANLPVISAAVAGNAVNIDHEHTEPTGVIRALIATADAPKEVQEKLPDGTPFVVAASYYEGTPEAIRTAKTISGEWLQTKRQDGRSEVVFIDTFAITDDPANDTVLGIGKVAALSADERNALPDSAFACPEDRSFPLDTVERTRNALARIQGPHESKCSKESMMERIMAAAKKFGIEVGEKATLDTSAKTNKASTGSPNPETPPMGDADDKTTPEAMQATLTSLKAQLDASKAEAKAARLEADAYKHEFETVKATLADKETELFDREANVAALGLLHTGRIPADKVGQFASLYKKVGKDQFQMLGDALPQTAMGAYAIKATATAPVSPEAHKAKLDALSKLLKEPA